MDEQALRGLIEKVCVARDEKVGVYGFLFYRGMFSATSDSGLVRT